MSDDEWSGGEKNLKPYSVAPFLIKTLSMIEDPSNASLISWSPTIPDAFVIHDSVEFAHSLLPKHFKHSNLSSFIRQLHTYGFRKVGIDSWTFAHPHFLPGREDLLPLIRRKRKEDKNASVPAPGAAASGSTGAPRSLLEHGNFGGKGEFDSLKRDKDMLLNELMRMRHTQDLMLEEIQETRRRQAETDNQVRSLVGNVGNVVNFLQILFQNHPSLPSNLRKRARQSYAVPAITWQEQMNGMVGFGANGGGVGGAGSSSNPAVVSAPRTPGGLPNESTITINGSGSSGGGIGTGPVFSAANMASPPQVIHGDEGAGGTPGGVDMSDAIPTVFTPTITMGSQVQPTVSLVPRSPQLFVQPRGAPVVPRSTVEVTSGSSPTTINVPSVDSPLPFPPVSPQLAASMDTVSEVASWSKFLNDVVTQGVAPYYAGDESD